DIRSAGPLVATVHADARAAAGSRLRCRILGPAPRAGLGPVRPDPRGAGHLGLPSRSAPRTASTPPSPISAQRSSRRRRRASFAASWRAERTDPDEPPVGDDVLSPPTFGCGLIAAGSDRLAAGFRTRSLRGRSRGGALSPP